MKPPLTVGNGGKANSERARMALIHTESMLQAAKRCDWDVLAAAERQCRSVLEAVTEGQDWDADVLQKALTNYNEIMGLVRAARDEVAESANELDQGRKALRAYGDCQPAR